MSTDCKEQKNQTFSRGRGQGGRYQGNRGSRGNGRRRGRGEATMRTNGEAVMCVRDQKYRSGRETDWRVKNSTWLVDSGSTSHMRCDTNIFYRIYEESMNR